jgi:hypothetical protein
VFKRQIENVNFSDTLATPSDNVSTSRDGGAVRLGYSRASKWLRLLMRLDHVASVIVNADDGVV